MTLPALLTAEIAALPTELHGLMERHASACLEHPAAQTLPWGDAPFVRAWVRA